MERERKFTAEWTDGIPPDLTAAFKSMPSPLKAEVKDFEICPMA